CVRWQRLVDQGDIDRIVVEIPMRRREIRKRADDLNGMFRAPEHLSNPAAREDICGDEDQSDGTHWHGLLSDAARRGFHSLAKPLYAVRVLPERKNFLKFVQNAAI